MTSLHERDSILVEAVFTLGDFQGQGPADGDRFPT